MKTQFCDRQASRDRQANCLLVTFNGTIHTFTGVSIPGVCHAVGIDSKKDGKWSHSVWEITHAETTSVVQWHDDFDSGFRWPQASWDAGYLWLKSRAPMVSWDAYQDYIRANVPKTAARWDSADAAEAEFGFAATPEEIAAMQAAKGQAEAELAEYKAEQSAKRAMSPFAKLAGLA